MPVHKFKTLQEAERALWNFKPDAGYYKMLHSLFDLAFRYSTFQCERGVHKFKTLKDANLHRMNSVLKKMNRPIPDKGNKKPL